MLPGPDGGEDCDHPGVHAPADGCAAYNHDWVRQADNNGGHVMLYHYNGELNCGNKGYYSLGELVEMGTLTSEIPSFSE